MLEFLFGTMPMSSQIIPSFAKHQGLEIPGEFCEFEQGQHSKPQKRQKRQKGRVIGSGCSCNLIQDSSMFHGS